MPVTFQVELPDAEETLRGHIVSALARGLPAPPTDLSGPVSLVASGPSATVPQGVTCAVNGALGLFDTPPTYWVACDSQALVSDWLKDPPKETTYLVASKCHPEVFDALKDRDVRLWHVWNGRNVDIIPNYWAVPTSVSVTVCAFMLLHAMGFERIDTYGWDGCYLDGRDHIDCHRQVHIAQDIQIDVQGTLYPTTTTWAAEANDAFLVLKHSAAKVRPHGPGLFGAVLRAKGLAA